MKKREVTFNPNTYFVIINQAEDELLPCINRDYPAAVMLFPSTRTAESSVYSNYNTASISSVISAEKLALNVKNPSVITLHAI